jgi:CHAT domain-containing protein
MRRSFWTAGLSAIALAATPWASGSWTASGQEPTAAEAELAADAARPGEEAAAYESVLNWKGATLARQRAARLAADNPELAPLWAELQSVVSAWSTLVRNAAPDDPDWTKLADELAARKASLEAELGRRSADLDTAAPIDVETLQRALPDGAALIDYVAISSSEPSADQPGALAPRRSLVAFVVRSKGEVSRFDLGDAAPIDEAIARWRRGYGISPDAVDAGRLLREMLWTPLVDAIGDAKLVLISPEGALCRLPFAALPGSREGAYLIEEVALAVVPTARLIPVLVTNDDLTALPKDLLVLGGVDYDDRARRDGDAAERPASLWRHLSGTDSEAAFVAQLYMQATDLPAGSDRVVQLRGADATEERFRSLAPQCHLLHVATHGFFANDVPGAGAGASPGADAAPSTGDNSNADRLAAAGGRSPGLLTGLVFAGANDPPLLPVDPAGIAALPDDGILTADEIASIPLSGVALVVLSASETALGEAAEGEGLLSIQRAFHVAGARTTIATLWKVNDQATRRIMEEFYRNYLQRAMSPLDALRAAQLWALNSSDRARGADALTGDANAGRLPPQFWAAFTLSGDWR